MRTGIGSRASALALAISTMPGLAHAQSGMEGDDAFRTGPTRSTEIQEIIVTAERRAQSIQDSSLSISVLDETALSSVSEARDLGTLVSGLQITNGGVTLQSFIRGIGDYGSSAINQSAVAYNLDGVYVANTAEVSTQFYDLQRVEVLKGPQGTLYGRNASAGAINLIFNPPRLGEVSGEITAGIGNYDSYQLTGALNVPLGENAALRLAGNWLKRDGYLSDGTEDDDQISGRAQLLVQPSNGFSIRISGSIAHRSGLGPGAVPLLAGVPKFSGTINAVSNAAKLANAPRTFTPGAGLPPADYFTQTGLLRDMFVDIDQREIHAEVRADLGFAELTFIPSYRSADSSIGTYSSGAIFLNEEDIRQESYELRLARDFGVIDLVVGGYYLNLDQDTTAQIFQSQFVIVDQAADLGTKSYAFFGQATVNATDDLRLIAGVRYTNEDRSIDAFGVNSTAFGTPPDTFDVDSRVTFKKWSWRLGIEYDVAPDNMLYFTASSGFKSGGFNVFEPTPTFSNAYQPETLHSYVIGARNQFFDRTVQFNVEAFYWDYKDSQQNRLAVTPSGALQLATFNAASAMLYGFDADLLVRPTPNGTISATLSYLHTKFDEFLFETPFPSNPAANGCVLDNSGPFTVDCSGFPLPRAPRWSGSVGYVHIFDLSNGGNISIGGDMQFASSRFIGAEYIPALNVSGYARFNAQIGYNHPRGALSISAYIRNIGNEQIPRGGSLRDGVIYADVSPPRTYGLKLTTQF